MQFDLRYRRRAFEPQIAGTSTLLDAGGQDQTAQRHEDVVGQAGEETAALGLVFDDAQRSQHAGLVHRELGEA